MRRRFTVLVVAATSIVLVAFLIPLTVLVRETAVDRAMAAGTNDAQNIAAVVGVVPDGRIRDVVDQSNLGGTRTTVWLPDGTTIGPPLAPSDSITVARSGRALTAETADGQEVLVPVETRSGRAVVRTLVPSAMLTSGVPQALLTLGLLAIALLILTVVVADRMSKATLRRISALAGTARKLAHGDLTARFDASGAGELDEVGAALTALAGRIGELLRREREAVADLSHRLRTPLTALRLEAGTLADPAESSRMVALVGVLERTTNRIIAEVRRPGLSGSRTVCDAAAVVADRVTFWTPLAEDQDRVVRLASTPGPLPVRLAPGDLAAIVDALLENVFAHTPEGTEFAVAVHARVGGGASLVVEDAGPGLARDHVLRRGTSHSGSTGLGLDIVRRGAESSGGTVDLGRSSYGGARIRVDLGPPVALRSPTSRQRARPSGAPSRRQRPRAKRGA